MLGTAAVFFFVLLAQQHARRSHACDRQCFCRLFVFHAPFGHSGSDIVDCIARSSIRLLLFLRVETCGLVAAFSKTRLQLLGCSEMPLQLTLPHPTRELQGMAQGFGPSLGVYKLTRGLVL